MTGSDLCASAKPWDLQLETVAVIYEEFYIQVDAAIKSMIIIYMSSIDFILQSLCKDLNLQQASIQNMNFGN